MRHRESAIGRRHGLPFFFFIDTALQLHGIMFLILVMVFNAMVDETGVPR
jgi:hypothetical protein